MLANKSLNADAEEGPRVIPGSERDFATEGVLKLSDTQSLIHGVDSLIIFDKHKSGSYKTCHGAPPAGRQKVAIPFHNVVWAELKGSDINIEYAYNVNKKILRITSIQFQVDDSLSGVVEGWVERLLEKSYGDAQRRKRIKVLVNPFGGKGYAEKFYARDIEPIFKAARCKLDVEKTQSKGHAIDIAEKLDVEAFDAVATCSGDGVAHEVFNGLAKKSNAGYALSKVAVVQLPCGTGNAMSWSLNDTGSCSVAALSIIKGVRTPMDLASVTQGDERILSFLSQAVGIIADSDLGTEHLRWLGDARFTWGLVKGILGQHIFPVDVAIKAETSSKQEVQDHFFSEAHSRFSMPPSRRKSSHVGSHKTKGLPKLEFGTQKDPLPQGWELKPYDNLGNWYCGNMTYMTASVPYFPYSLPHDGCWDLVNIDGDINTFSALKMLTAVEKETLFDMPQVTYRKISGYRIIPKSKNGYISIDGESFPFGPFQVEVHRGLGTVLTRTGRIYEGHTKVKKEVEKTLTGSIASL